MSFLDFDGGAVNSHKIPHCVKLWTAKIILAHGKEAIFRNHGFGQEDAIRVVGLEHWLKKDYSDIKKSDFLKALKAQCEKLEQRSKSPSNKYLKSNIRKIAKLLNLTDMDCRILELAIYLHTESVLNSVMDIIGEINSLKVYTEISRILDVPESDVRKSLAAEGTMAKSGLLVFNRRGNQQLCRKLELFSDSFADRMISANVDILDLIKDMVVKSSKPTLTLKDYEHIKQPVDLLLPYLKQSLQEKKQGVNFLIYGSPGTGKTQLVKVLAEKLKKPLYEVAFENESGAPVIGYVRLKACSVAQHFFSKSPALLIFDEVEDIFNDGGWNGQNTAQLHKAWLNRNLEENKVPTFWITNSIKSLDRAFVRRFDMVFELPNPPKTQREDIVRHAGEQILDDDSVKRIAESDVVSPAVISRASNFVRSIKDKLPADTLSSSVEYLVSNTLAAQGHKRLEKKKVEKPGMVNEKDVMYDISYINADTDVSGLAEGLKKNSNARLCFYGPPGTGKTEFGRWLAKTLDKKLIVKRGSDLLSKWIGETEQNIAKAFKEASDGESILLIDEVDSFLQDRRKAERSWEVTQVNEMLTQVEQFDGIFIASTNLVDNLDQASLRRFDLKIKFDYLKVEQAYRMIESYTMALEIPICEASFHFDGIEKLAAGDFASITRRHRFKPFDDIQAFVNALAQECQLKEGGKQRRIGFV